MPKDRRVTSQFTFSLSGGQRSEIKVSAGWVSSEAFLLDLQMATFSLCPHMAYPPCRPVS